VLFLCPSGHPKLTVVDPRAEGSGHIDP
jgi:hypothetical protein